MRKANKIILLSICICVLLITGIITPFLTRKENNFLSGRMLIIESDESLNWNKKMLKNTLEYYYTQFENPFQRIYTPFIHRKITVFKKETQPYGREDYIVEVRTFFDIKIGRYLMNSKTFEN